MISTTEVMYDPALLEQQFYSKKFYFSYSGLNRLLYSPGLFYRYYVLQHREEKLDNYLIGGKVVHCLLLENGKFNENFIVSPSKLPEGNAKVVIDKVYNIYTIDQSEVLREKLEDYEVEILEILRNINLHQSLKTDPQRIEKILTEQNISYWNFLKLKANKDIVDAETLDYCLKSVEIIKNNPVVCNLLGIDKIQTSTFRVYNEILLKRDLDNIPFGLKGVIDNLVVDAKAKHIYINDLKTTSKSLADFGESIEFYNYWMQSAIYLKLVEEFLKDHIDASWNITFNFIVIDKHQHVYSFEVTKETMELWQDKLHNKLNEALWHYNSRQYSLPHKFATSQVKL